MKLFTIIKREYLTRARTRGFLVFTILLPVVAAGFLFMEYKIIQASKNVHTTIAVVDLSRRIYPALQQALERGQDGNPSQFSVREVDATPATMATVEAGLRQQVLDKQYDGYLVVPADVFSSRKASYYARNAAAVTVKATIEDDLRDAISQVRMQAAGISPDQIAAMNSDFDLEQVKVSQAGDAADNGQTAIVAGVLVFVLYVVMLLYGVTVMKAVTEEKTTRISEVLLASVDPFSLMLGKILGVVAVALTQLGVWAVCAALASAYGITMASAAGASTTLHIPHIAPGLLVAFVVFFLLGFLLYASIYAAIGSMVSSDQEAQQTQAPLTMVLIAAIYLAFLVMASPSSTLSVVLSLIPFFAPVLMLVRIAVSNPPWWQVAASVVLCFGTFLVFTKVTAKIYRVGILMTGKRPNLPELLRWLKYA